MPLDRAVNVAEFLANQFDVLNSPSPQPQSRQTAMTVALFPALPLCGPGSDCSDEICPLSSFLLFPLGTASG